MALHADLVIPASDRDALKEIALWDGFRPATFPVSDFPMDVVRFEGAASRPVVVSRGRRAETLKAMPASLRERAAAAFERAGRAPGSLKLARGAALDLSRGPVLMGILNVTPDSFSDGGLYFDRGRAVEGALRMFEEGAAVVDVGGESTRPKSYGAARELSADEEIARVIPVISGIRAQTRAPISVDTRKAAVAREALAAGADLVNDITAGRFDLAMAETIARAGAGTILMHMKGTDPRTMQDDVHYDHPLGDVASLLARAAERAIEAGAVPESIVFDPGLGFGKSPEGSLLLLRNLAALRSLGFPLAVGASRKAFVRRFSGVADDSPASDRLPGSLAALGAAAAAGASILRVHDVAASARFLRMTQSIARATAPAPAPVGEPVR